MNVSILTMEDNFRFLRIIRAQPPMLLDHIQNIGFGRGG